MAVELLRCLLNTTAANSYLLSSSVHLQWLQFSVKRSCSCYLLVTRHADSQSVELATVSPMTSSWRHHQQQSYSRWHNMRHVLGDMVTLYTGSTYIIVRAAGGGAEDYTMSYYCYFGLSSQCAIKSQYYCEPQSITPSSTKKRLSGATDNVARVVQVGFNLPAALRVNNNSKFMHETNLHVTSAPYICILNMPRHGRCSFSILLWIS